MRGRVSAGLDMAGAITGPTVTVVAACAIRLAHPRPSLTTITSDSLAELGGDLSTMASDIKPRNMDEAIAPLELTGRAPRWRFLARGVALVLVLCAGWVAGVKTQGSVDVAQLSSAVATNVSAIRTDLAISGSKLVAWLQDRMSDRGITAEEHSSALAERAAVGPGAAGNVEGISLELSHLRSSSEAATESLRGATDRLASVVDNNQQRLWDKLEDLGNRLNNLERSGGLLAGPVLAKLEQLDERLDRIERSAMALRAAQPPALANSSTPAAEPKAAQVQALAPTPEPKSSEKSQAPAEPKKIAGWIVREVINGTAILQGPRGVVGVSAGDVVPGLGRVQSIARQSGRWIVATHKGLITTR